MGKQSAPPAEYGGAPWQQGQQQSQPQQGGYTYDAQHGRWTPNTNSGGGSDPKLNFYGAAGWQDVSGHTNQNTPWAQSSWSQDPKTGQWTQNVGLNGPLAGYAQGLEGQIAGQGPLDFSSLPGLTDGSAARDHAIQGAYGQAASRLDPMWSQREQNQKAELVAQGLDPSSEAYQNAMGTLGRERNDAYTSAMNAAIGQGTQAGNALFNQSLQGRQQMLAEMLRAHSQPMQDLQGLQGFTGGFQGVGAAGAAPWLQAIMGLGQYGIGQANQSNQGWADFWKGVSGAGQAGAAAIACDERIKANVVRHATEWIPGVPEASFEYLSEPGRRYRGVVAQDVEKVRPDLVVEIDGIKHVRGLRLTEET